MISAAADHCSSFPHSQARFHMYEAVVEEMLSESLPPAPSGGLFYDLSVLRDKLDQVESIVSFMVSSGPVHRESASAAAAGAAALVQELIVAASSLVLAFQQLASASAAADVDELSTGSGKAFDGDETVNHADCGPDDRVASVSKIENFHEYPSPAPAAAATWDVIELDAADLLAKYTHYCHICGKGFKRDANLRMHMRAHGDEYKTNAALSNPTKSGLGGGGNARGAEGFGGSPRKKYKYSCPQEGCRWNRKHAKFQPLKSMVCVKNHYRRSHCPKMYVCNRCSRKQFSVLSDLRTHEKHCGDLKWRCSCGTTFSRKDKLMGHVALFVGHAPAFDGRGSGGGGSLAQIGNINTCCVSSCTSYAC